MADEDRSWQKPVAMPSDPDSLLMSLNLVLPLVLAAALFGFAGLALSGGYLASRRRFEMRVATLNYLAAVEFAPAGLADRRTFRRAIARVGSSGGKFPDELTEEEREAFLRIMNRYELEAVAVKHRALDRDIILEYQGSLINKDWHYAAPIVYALRNATGNIRIFAEFEAFSRSVADRLAARDRPAVLSRMLPK